MGTENIKCPGNGSSDRVFSMNRKDLCKLETVWIKRTLKMYVAGRRLNLKEKGGHES